MAITDQTGTVTDTFKYDTYGKLLSRTGTTFVIFGYNGRDGVVTDTNGLIYMRARYYSPELRRFVNADIIPGEISQAVTLNRYAYANGNPVSNVDPFGLAVEDKSNISFEDVLDSAEVVLKTGWGFIKIFFNSLEVSVGAGLGMMGRTTIDEIFGLKAGIRYDTISFHLKDGKLSFGDEYELAYKASAFLCNLGYEESFFRKNLVGSSDCVPKQGFYTDDTFTFYEAGAYFIAGANVSVGIDLIQLSEDLGAFFEEVCSE